MIAVADGTNPRRLRTGRGAAHQGSWSPKGRQLLVEKYDRYGSEVIWRMTSDGSDRRYLTHGRNVSWRPRRQARYRIVDQRPRKRPESPGLPHERAWPGLQFLTTSQPTARQSCLAIARGCCGSCASAPSRAYADAPSRNGSSTASRWPRSSEVSFRCGDPESQRWGLRSG